MAYIGKQPTAVPLTSSDLEDNIVTSAKIIDGTIALADLSATGTKDSTTFLRGDNTFASAGGGKIGQVVSTNKTDTFSESVGSASFSSIVTGLTVSITPSATTSKILVLVDMNIGADGEHGLAFQLFRDTTQIDLADASSSRARLSKGRVQNSGSSSYQAALSTNFLDSPSSTSALTYGVKIGHTSISSKTLYINRSHDDTNDASFGRGASTITVMEILA